MISVLDHGMVRLVDHMGADLSIARNAKVSYDAAWRAGENKGSDAKLIKYLYNHGHNTPFECVNFTFEVKAPIFVFRQWHRHRTQSYNEISARYKELPEVFYIPEPHLVGKQSPENKQMRITISKDEYALLSMGEKSEIDYGRILLRDNNRQCFETYRKLLGMGWPRELARSALPFGTYSHMFATMNLHNLFGFLRERLHEHAQYEIRVYAQAMLELIEPIVPVAVEAFRAKL